MKINLWNHARGFLLRGRVAVLAIVLVVAGLFGFATPAWATTVRVVEQDGSIYYASSPETHENWSWDGDHILTLDGFLGQEISFYGGTLDIIVHGDNLLVPFNEEYSGSVRYAPYGESPTDYWMSISGGGLLTIDSGISNLGGVIIDDADVEVRPEYSSSDSSCKYVVSADEVIVRNGGCLAIDEGGIRTGRLNVYDSTLDVAYTRSVATPVEISGSVLWRNSFISVRVMSGTSVTSGNGIDMADEMGGFNGNKYALEGDVSLVPTGFMVLEDLERDTPHLMDILWLYGAGITTGFPDGTFRPYASVARCDMAAFLYRLYRSNGGPGYTPTETDKQRFYDVNEDTPHCNEIWWLAHMGISIGFPDGGFHPLETVKRCDMAAFLYRLADVPPYPPTPEDRAMFSDVNNGTPHCNEIWWLAHTGISTGFPNGTFRPYAEVARCDMAAFLFRLYRYLNK